MAHSLPLNKASIEQFYAQILFFYVKLSLKKFFFIFHPQFTFVSPLFRVKAKDKGGISIL